MNSLEELAGKIKQITVFPNIVSKLASVVADPAAKIDEITAVISYDPGLTANLYKWANSALWGSQREISTVREAIIHLGTGRILNVLVGGYLQKTMEEKCIGYGLEEGELWRHSVASSIAAEEITKLAKESLPPEAFTAALLHDIGKIILKQNMNSEMIEEINRRAEEDHIPYVDAEKSVLGFGHPEVGWQMAVNWKFPESLTYSILHHHDPDCEPGPVTDTVHVSNLAAKSSGIGLGNEAMQVAASMQAAGRIGLSRKDFEKVCIAVLERMPMVESLYL